MVTIHDITCIIPAGDPSDDNNMPHAAISRASQWFSATVRLQASLYRTRQEGRTEWVVKPDNSGGEFPGWLERGRA